MYLSSEDVTYILYINLMKIFFSLTQLPALTLILHFGMLKGNNMQQLLMKR